MEKKIVVINFKSQAISRIWLSISFLLNLELNMIYNAALL